MEQATINSDLPILKAELPQFKIENIEKGGVTVGDILESGERIFNEIQKLTGKKDATQTNPPADTTVPTEGGSAFKVPDQAKSAFNTVASYVGWGGAALATAVLIRKILK